MSKALSEFNPVREEVEELRSKESSVLEMQERVKDWNQI